MSSVQILAFSAPLLFASLALNACVDDPEDLQVGGDREDGAGQASDAGQDSAPITRKCSYYADPVNGNASNDGSMQFPWGSMESLLASSQILSAGDVVCLLSGDHGAPRVIDRNYSSDVVFTVPRNESAQISGLQIVRSSGIVFESIAIDAAQSIDPSLDEKDRFIVVGGVDSHYISFLNVSLQSANSIDSWTKEDWYKRAKSGFDMRGTNIIVRNCRVKNTYHAISLRGDNSEISHTLVDNFAGDGIRGLGSFSLYEHNTVRDAYVNDYAIQHDDMFQAFDLSDDPKIEGVVIRNNQFIQFLDPITEFVVSNDLVSRDVQGVIITDGYADTWLVENNLVVVDHFHGITLYGARHSRVQNNTVVQSANTSDTDVPWIRLTVQTKTGHDNFDNIIRNNLAAMFTTAEYSDTSVVENNSDIDQASQSDYRRFFRDYDNQDYQLAANSPAINAGVNLQLADTDLAGGVRLQRGTVDTGAYEYQE